MSRPGSIEAGGVSLSADEFDAQVTARAVWAARAAAPAGLADRVVPIRAADPLNALIDAFAVRVSGGIPVIGDDRWEVRQWGDLQRACDDLVAPSGLAWATLTSGSTRQPRLILRSDASWSASYATIADLLDLTPESIVFVPMHLVSSMAVFSVAMARATGHGVRFPRLRQLGAGDLDGVTHVHATPSLFGRILDLIEGGARHDLRVALIGGAVLDASMRRRASSAGIRVVTYYGAAELSFVAFDADGTGLKVFPGVETRVALGRLWVRSEYLAACYAGNTDGPLVIDAEGWATVGDLASLDEDGRLRLRGREDGAILSAGATVIPEEVEAVLRGVPGVRDAVVFGSAVHGNDSLVTAVVELETGAQLTEATAREHVRSALMLPHRPRLWYRMESIPLTASGKPARSRVRDAVTNGEVQRLGK